MKRLLIVALASLLTFVVFSQDEKSHLKLGITGGFGGYSFDKLKDFNNDIINQLPFDAAVVDDFPDRFYFGGNALVRIAEWYWAGPSYQFHSTGSRVGAKDYSGSYHLDQILSTHQLGLENEIRISKSVKPSVFLDISGGVNFSTWKTEGILEISGEKEEEHLEYNAIKPFVLPGIKIAYPIYKNLSVSAQAGYLFDLGGKYHLSGNNEYKTTIKVPWSGYRFSLGLEYNVLW